MFCTDTQAMDMEELLNGLPWTDDAKITWLRVADFRLHLMTKRINITMQRIWSAIRIHVEPLEKTVATKGLRVRVMGVPAFAEQTEAFSVPKIAEPADF